MHSLRTLIFDEPGRFVLERHQRHVTARLQGAWDVLSTSHRQGGLRHDLNALANHQSCEGSGHDERFGFILGMGQDAYHRHACEEAGLDPDRTALMGTAANMRYTATATLAHDDLRVWVAATAGVGGNAGRAGEEATWVEAARPEGADSPAPAPDPVPSGVPDRPGTINLMVLISQPLRPGGLARAAVTITEAKTAVLMELGIVSKRTWEMATGTGTDQYAIAAPAYTGMGLAWPGTHAKLGELLGKAVSQAVREALRWQNGLEYSLRRHVCRSLERFGLTEAWWAAWLVRDPLPPGVGPGLAKLMKDNREAVLHDPLLAASAVAIAAIEEKRRYGILPDSAAREALLGQLWAASCLFGPPAADLRSLPGPWLRADGDLDLAEGFAMAMALAWEAKWTR